MKAITDDINRYFDEGLNSAEEENLFKELANSAEARDVFNQHLKLNMGMLRDAIMISSPAESTEYIFNKLGFSTPNSSNINKKLKKGSKKLLVAILILMFASLVSVTILGLFEALRGGDTSQPSLMQTIYDDNKIINSLFNLSDNKNIEKNTENKVNKIGQGLTRKQKTQKLLEAIYGNPTGEQAKLENETGRESSELMLASKQNFLNEIDNILSLSLKKATPISSESILDTDKTFFSQNLLTPTDEQENDRLKKIEEDYISTNKTIYNISLNKGLIQNSYMPEVQQTNSFWNNANLRFSYNLTDEHALGAEIGWKDFPQTFSRTIRQNTFNQQQFPMFLYGKFLYSYNLANLLTLEKIQPFTQLSLGGTSVGPIIGLDLGAYLNIYNNSGIVVSGNFDMLFYNVENKIYNSDKIGLKLGIFYGF